MAYLFHGEKNGKGAGRKSNIVVTDVEKIKVLSEQLLVFSQAINTIPLTH